MAARKAWNGVLVVAPLRWLWRAVVVRLARWIGAVLRLFGNALGWAFRKVGQVFAVVGRLIRDAVVWAVRPLWRLLRWVFAPIGRAIRQVWRIAVTTPARWVRTSVLAPIRDAGRKLRGAFRRK